MGCCKKNQPKKEDTISGIKTSREENQEVEITMDEISAEKKAGKKGASDAEIKAAIETINPDESSMDSRG